ncbi:MAG: hypothetical protein KatS3mg110_1187 [Pirellulaceae bacterium]|nr:MAG: hypothetical protein KatS3mg110_1187 [Pirellulaceae bacterium]
MTHEVELAGCTPEPLMHYLKSLGVLRLVCEQADAKAAGCWRNDRFVLRSVLDESSLVDFFLHKYRPSPILTPWAGGSGFFEKDNHKAVDAIEKSSTPRLEVYRECIRRVKTILANEGVKQKPSSEVKARLLRRYRGEMPDEFVRWMDAAMVIQADDQTFAPLLGTGGNDGRLDFAQNFMQRLVDQLKFTQDGPQSHQEELLRNALFGEPVAGLSAAAVGQFAPGRAGGPNATQGMEGDSTDNPWDFVLMLEGTLLFAGALVRRAGIYSGDKAAFPFTVRPRPIGGASSSDNELGAARGEMWLPLWSRFAGLGRTATAACRRPSGLRRSPCKRYARFCSGRRSVGNRSRSRTVHPIRFFPAQRQGVPGCGDGPICRAERPQGRRGTVT